MWVFWPCLLFDSHRAAASGRLAKHKPLSSAFPALAHGLIAEHRRRMRGQPNPNRRLLQMLGGGGHVWLQEDEQKNNGFKNLTVFNTRVARCNGVPPSHPQYLHWQEAMVEAESLVAKMKMEACASNKEPFSSEAGILPTDTWDQVWKKLEVVVGWVECLPSINADEKHYRVPFSDSPERQKYKVTYTQHQLKQQIRVVYGWEQHATAVSPADHLHHIHFDLLVKSKQKTANRGKKGGKRTQQKNCAGCQKRTVWICKVCRPRQVIFICDDPVCLKEHSHIN